MKVSGFQRTIAKSFSLKGTGIHTGGNVSVNVEPAEPDSGIKFYNDKGSLLASASNVCSTLRCTTLKKESITVSTVEHFLSCCFMFQISNLNVRIDGDELPIMDGSALPIGEAFKEAGIIETESLRNVIEIKKSFSVSMGDSMMVGMPSSTFSAACMVDYNHPIAGEQAFFFDGDEDLFLKELSPARTFGFWEEIKTLLEKKLALGGTLDNALVIKQGGYMNQPRFPDEIVRHKLLDVLGDLALSEMGIKGHIYAYKPSHSINVEFAKNIKEQHKGAK